MRYLDFKSSQLNEIAMNPTAFNQSMSNSDQVKVGFEFECIVPEASLNTWKQSLNDTQKTKEEIIDDVKTKNVKEFCELIPGFNDVNNFFFQYITPRDSTDGVLKLYRQDFLPSLYYKELSKTLSAQFRKMKRAYASNGYSPTEIETNVQRAKDEVKRIFNDKLQVDLASRSKRKLTYDEIGMISYALYTDSNWSAVERTSRVLRHWIDINAAASSDLFTKWVMETYGTDNMGELLATKWKIAAGGTTKLLNYIRNRNSNSNRIGNGYQGTSKMMQAVFEPIFGEMIIFSRYHEGTKKLDRWYIEPDGSLGGQGNDQGLEIVGPPEPAPVAMSTLSKFFTTAKQYNVYTNSTTGLHINVSVPDKLDVLKLALILGDEYVLNMFGRGPGTPGSRYARSLLINLKKEVKSNSIRTTRSQEDMMKYLPKLAKDMSSDHFSSINYNGKYVSFRAAGNDYLNNPEGIINTLGRFVRAMIIASDPDAHKEDYLKKLYQLSNVSTPKQNVWQTLMNYRQSGVQAIKIDCVTLDTEKSFSKNAIIERAIRRGLINTHGWSGMTNADPSNWDNNVEIQILLNNEIIKSEMLAGDTGFGPETKEKLINAPANQYYSILIYPKTILAADNFAKSEINSRAFNAAGDSGIPFYGRVFKINISQGDGKLFSDIISSMAKNAKSTANVQ